MTTPNRQPLQRDYEPAKRSIDVECLEQTIAALEMGLEAATELHASVADANGDRLPIKTRYYAKQVEIIERALHALRKESGK